MFILCDRSNKVEKDDCFQDSRDLIPFHTIQKKMVDDGGGVLSFNMPTDTCRGLNRNLLSARIPYESLGYGFHVPPYGTETGDFKHGVLYQGNISDIGSQRPECAPNGYPYEILLRYSTKSHQWMIDFIVAKDVRSARQAVTAMRGTNSGVHMFAAETEERRTQEWPAIPNTIGGVTYRGTTYTYVILHVFSKYCRTAVPQYALRRSIFTLYIWYITDI
eukprot:SAG11_NODE_278_length_11284_cov_202.732231_11_plen_219_part_00